MALIDTIYEIYKASGEVTTDSRTCTPGSLFVALKGERFDGNRFADQAIERGAAAAIVDDPQAVKDKRYILVEDSLATLQQLATHHRLQFSLPLIALTGSNGKTTTKNLLCAVLSSQYECHCTPGNLNNHIGVPLTLLKLRPTSDVCVVEMGANHKGEIARLCEIARPTHGLVTNVGKAHLEGFGGFEGVKIGKGEMYDYLAANGGVAFVNRAEQHLSEMASRVQHKIFYDSRPLDFNQSDFLVNMRRETPRVEVSYHDRDGLEIVAESRLFGYYNFQNISTAISIGKYFRVPALKIKAAVEAFEPDDNRSQVIQYKGGEIILDAYNANPTSMRNALLYFAELKGHRKLAILADMLELGQGSEAEHHSLAQLASTLDIDEVVLVGPEFAKAAVVFGFRHAPSVVHLNPWWAEQELSGKRVLLKGSRGMQLEKLLDLSTETANGIE